MCAVLVGSKKVYFILFDALVINIHVSIRGIIRTPIDFVLNNIDFCRKSVARSNSLAHEPFCGNRFHVLAVSTCSLAVANELQSFAGTEMVAKTTGSKIIGTPNRSNISNRNWNWNLYLKNKLEQGSTKSIDILLYDKITFYVRF